MASATGWRKFNSKHNIELLFPFRPPFQRKALNGGGTPLIGRGRERERERESERINTHKRRSVVVMMMMMSFICSCRNNMCKSLSVHSGCLYYLLHPHERELYKSRALARYVDVRVRFSRDMV